MPINNRARQYFDYQLRDVPSYDNPYDSYLEKRKKLDEELDKLGVQDDLERDRIAAEYLGRAPIKDIESPWYDPFATLKFD